MERIIGNYVSHFLLRHPAWYHPISMATINVYNLPTGWMREAGGVRSCSSAPVCRLGSCIVNFCDADRRLAHMQDICSENKGQSTWHKERSTWNVFKGPAWTWHTSSATHILLLRASLIAKPWPMEQGVYFATVNHGKKRNRGRIVKKKQLEKT